jgi:glycosyl transferase, family 25
MKIFVINLERKPQRWQRMAEQLRGLDFHRVPAVDGTGMDGPEFNIKSRSPGHENLSRFGRACAMSHRLACQEFLGGKDDFCCILEDDVMLGPEFARFMSETGWIPRESNIVRLETTRQKILLGAQSLTALNRRLFRL